MPHDPISVSSRPRFRLRYLLALVFMILVAPIIAFSAWSSIEAARLDRVFDALETRNEPLDIADFSPKAATTEQRQASHYYAQAGRLVGDLMPQSLTATGRAIGELCASADPVIRKERAASLKAFEDRYTQALELLDRAAALDANGWDDVDRPPAMSMDANRPYQLARVNTVRIARLACSGDPEGAANALVATLRVRRVLPRWAGPGLGIQTGHSLQLVLAAPPDPPLLQKIQQEYDTVADARGIESRVLFSRAQWLAFAQPGVFSDPPAGYATRRITPVEAIGVRLSRPARDHVTVSELREFDEVIDASKLPWPQKLDAAAKLDQKYPRRSRRGGVVSALMRPLGPHAANNALQFSIAGAAESLAQTRASIGAVAVARWRAAHAGALPASLNDLIPAYLASPLIDPYTGTELRYVSDGRSCKIYSVGKNRKDDGGTWEQHSDLQTARRGDPLDIGIAVTTLPELP